MYAQCLECLTIYKLAADTLVKGHGMVRCGYCSAVFDALHTLTEQLPPEPIEYLDLHKPEAEPPQLQVPTLRPRAAAPETDMPAETSTSTQASLLPDRDKPSSSEKWRHTPAFAKHKTGGQRLRTWPWVAGTCALIISLGVELAYAERDWLTNEANVRPWLDEICIRLKCHLPPRSDPSKLELLSRDIRPHPSVPNALIVSATLRNAADFSQPFPVIEITLSDLDENRIGMRRFQPREYITDAKTLAHGMQSNSNAALVFEVADPGKNAIAFEFKFL